MNLNHGGDIKTGRLTTLKRVRKHCLVDCGGSPKEVRLCQVKQCYLYPLRMGKNLARKGIGVGSRAKNGRFQAVIASPAGVSEKHIGNAAMDMDKAALTNPGAHGKESGWSGIIVSEKGQIEVRKTKKGFQIELTND